MIAGKLTVDKNHGIQGRITYNGRSLLEHMKGVYIENAFGYVDQLDDHAALLTVGETLDFAFQCHAGGKFVREREGLTPEQINVLHEADRDNLALQVNLCILGLHEVKDTFVGGVGVRGVSGGQRRRVTVGEMIMSRVPVLCGDEISTGLDAASTYNMVEMLLHIGRRQRFSRVFSLLQPAPEVVSLFDEVIVLAEGHVIFAGPIERVEDYFADLGFVSPEFCDVADFLQLVSTDDRDDLYAARNDGAKAPSVEELAAIFNSSMDGARIQNLLESPQEYGLDPRGSVIQDAGIFHLEALKSKYANNWRRSILLISRRFLTLWVRDKKVLLFSVIRNVVNGASVGGAFLNAHDFISIQGALFQTGIFILLGSLQSVSGLVEDRKLYYKHSDANFYSAWPYVIGRAVSQVPQVRYTGIS
jgi:ABC-type multidrug transport system ATPase subunit